MVASKKPQLQAATPNEFEESAFVGDDAHDVLTERMNNPQVANRTFMVGIVRTTEAGGHDAGGARITKFGFEHMEMALNEKDEKDIRDLLVKIHKRRTMQSEVKALADPVKDTELPGLEAGAGDDVPDVDA